MNSEHPEARCDRCERPNPVWYTPPELWKQVEIDRGFNGVLCPSCFIDDAESQGITAPSGTPGWLVVNDVRAALDDDGRQDHDHCFDTWLGHKTCRACCQPRCSATPAALAVTTGD